MLVKCPCRQLKQVFLLCLVRIFGVTGEAKEDFSSVNPKNLLHPLKSSLWCLHWHLLTALGLLLPVPVLFWDWIYITASWNFSCLCPPSPAQSSSQVSLSWWDLFDPLWLLDWDMKYLPSLGRVLFGFFFPVTSGLWGDRRLSNIRLKSPSFWKILGYPFFSQTLLPSVMGCMPWKDASSFLTPGAHPCWCFWTQDWRRRGGPNLAPPAPQVAPWGMHWSLGPWADADWELSGKLPMDWDENCARDWVNNSAAVSAGNILATAFNTWVWREWDGFCICGHLFPAWGEGLRTWLLREWWWRDPGSASQCPMDVLGWRVWHSSSSCLTGSMGWMSLSFPLGKHNFIFFLT